MIEDALMLALVLGAATVGGAVGGLVVLAAAVAGFRRGDGG